MALTTHLAYRADATNQFYLIDVYDLTKEQFLPYEEGVAHATIEGLLQLRTMRTLGEGNFTFASLQQFMRGSDYRDGDKEGIVIKDYANQRFAKLVSTQFSEERDDAKGLATYLTPQRLRKCSLKLHNITGKRPTPQQLYEAFYQDLVKEAPADLINPERVDAWFLRHTKHLNR